MKLLWVVNIILPQAAHILNENESAFGGWISQMVNQLSKKPDIELAVVAKSDKVNDVKKHLHGNVTYYFVPQRNGNKYDVEEKYCNYVLQDWNPEILHTEGTETQFTFRMLNLWKGKNIVSMQGIINGYEPYEYGNLQIDKLLFSFNLRDVLFGFSLLLNKKIRFQPRLKFERRTIQLAQHIFGRTLWDRAHAYHLNPKATYFSCNRTLRPSFYKKINRSKVEPFSIFIGNASNPRKGAHFVVKAIANILDEFPDINLYVAGNSPFPKRLFDWKKKIGYPNYLLRLIREYGLENKVHFTGVLNEKKMADHLSKMSMFILPSTIENSPNTLGEAMMLGVPCITAVTGGTPQMAIDEEEALFYRDNDEKLLAYQIRRILIEDGLASKLSINGMKRAIENHNPTKNFDDLIKAYKYILEK